MTARPGRSVRKSGSDSPSERRTRIVPGTIGRSTSLQMPKGYILEPGIAICNSIANSTFDGASDISSRYNVQVRNPSLPKPSTLPFGPKRIALHTKCKITKSDVSTWSKSGCDWSCTLRLIIMDLGGGIEASHAGTWYLPRFNLKLCTTCHKTVPILHLCQWSLSGYRICT